MRQFMFINGDIAILFNAMDMKAAEAEAVAAADHSEEIIVREISFFENTTKP